VFVLAVVHGDSRTYIQPVE